MAVSPVEPVRGVAGWLVPAEGCGEQALDFADGEGDQVRVTAVDNGVQAMRSLTTLCGGICAFGVFHNAGYYGLADIVQRFHTLYPNVKIRLTGRNSVLLADAVAAREIEAAIVILPVPAEGLTIKPIAKDEVLYASATRDPGKGPVEIEELAAANLVLYDAWAGWRDPARHQIQEGACCACVKLDPLIEVEHRSYSPFAYDLHPVRVLRRRGRSVQSAPR